MAIKGFLEVRSSLQICGWAYDDEDANRHFTIEVCCGDQVLGLIMANYYRKDLETSAIGQGDHAFIFNCDPPIEIDDLSKITAKVLIPNSTPIDLLCLSPSNGIADRVKSELAISFPYRSVDDEHRPIVILGSARSGTSAIAHALLVATKYKGQEEGHFLEVLAPMLVQLHHFYSRKSDEFSGGRNTMIARVPEKFVKDALRSALVAATRQMFPGGFWIDKTPNANMIHLAPRLLEIWPNASFIFMKRRGIENILSRMRKFEYDFGHNCREWADAMTAWTMVRDQLKGRAMELDQRFVADRPEEAARNIGKIANLTDLETRRLAQTLAADRPQVTDRALLQTYSLYNIGWSTEELTLFDEVCGASMRDYGYTNSLEYYRHDCYKNNCLFI